VAWSYIHIRAPATVSNGPRHRAGRIIFEHVKNRGKDILKSGSDDVFE
jgi:hypothetical protein